MIKNVIIFRVEEMNHNSLDYWAELVAEQLMNRGVTVYYLYSRDSGEELTCKLANIISSVKIDAVIAFNSQGQQDWVLDRVNIWNGLGIPFFNYVLDHPLEHHRALISRCENYHIICIDLNHVSFVKQYYPNIKSVSFLPLAGFGNLKEMPNDHVSFKRRKYKLVLTAGLGNKDAVLDEIKNLPETMRKLAFVWMEYWENHLELSPENALRKILDDRYGKEMINNEMYLKIACTAAYVIPYVRMDIREKIVDVIAQSGLQINIWGNGWKSEKYGTSNLIFHDDINIAKTADIYHNTQLALNILPLFKCGTHDRIATAQINGAAILTDTNPYITEFYAGTEGIYEYSLNDIKKLPQIIGNILE